MTIDEYKDLMLEDESWIDGLLTTGFHAIKDDELFGEEITGYSLY